MTKKRLAITDEDRAIWQLSKTIHAVMPEGRELCMNDILQRIGKDTATEEDIHKAMRVLSRQKKSRTREMMFGGAKVKTWTACELEVAAREAEKERLAEEEAHKNFKEARKALALNFMEDNMEDYYREALAALEAWRPTPKFPKSKNKGRVVIGKTGVDAALKILSDKPKTCAEIYEAMRQFAKSEDAVRGMLNKLIKRGKAVKIKHGPKCVHYKAAE